MRVAGDAGLKNTDAAVSSAAVLLRRRGMRTFSTPFVSKSVTKMPLIPYNMRVAGDAELRNTDAAVSSAAVLLRRRGMRTFSTPFVSKSVAKMPLIPYLHPCIFGYQKVWNLFQAFNEGVSCRVFGSMADHTKMDDNILNVICEQLHDKTGL